MLVFYHSGFAETSQQKIDKLLADDQALLEKPFPHRIN
jgi:hypothetical protein